MSPKFPVSELNNYKEGFRTACDVIQELASKQELLELANDSRQGLLNIARRKLDLQANTIYEQKAAIDAAHVSYVAMKSEYETRQDQADSLIGLANCRAMTATARGNVLAKQLTSHLKYCTALHTIKAALNETDTQQTSGATPVRQVPSVSDTRDTDWYPCQ